MRHDKGSDLLHLTPEEQGYTRLSPVYGVEEAHIVLGAALSARDRTYAQDYSDFPPGEHRDKLVADHRQTLDFADSLVEQLTPFVEASIVPGFEAFLRDS